MTDIPDEKAVARVDSDLSTAPFTSRSIQTIAHTEFVPRELRGNVPAIYACIMAGREWGLGPMESLSRIDMIDGRPTPSGELLVARVLAAGHLIYPKEITPEGATVVLERRDKGVTVFTYEFTFTMDDARRIVVRKDKQTGKVTYLADKENFRNYPGVMCYWRAATQVIRIGAPDVLTSFRAYTPDELGSDDWVPPPPGEEASTGPESELADPDDGGGDDTAEAAEVLEGEVVPVQEPPASPAPQDKSQSEKPEQDEVFFFEELVGYVTKWLHGDEPAARMEVKRVQGRKKMTRDLARTLYSQLRTRLVPADEQGEQATLEG
jgi:hypothetical protein